MANNNMIVKYQTDNGQEITLTPGIVRSYLVSGQGNVTDQEVLMFLKLCQYRKLNPFLREAYLIKYSNNEPATIVVGKDLFTKRASANEKCEGYNAGVIVQNSEGKIIEREGSMVLPDETLVGGWAEVMRRGWAKPVKMTVSLQEYLRKKKDGTPHRNWAEMPATMIRKVALVQALREAFPEDFGGMYSPEEMPIDTSRLDDKPIEIVHSKVIDVTPEPVTEPSQTPQPEPAKNDTERKKFFANLQDWAKQNGFDWAEVEEMSKKLICEAMKVDSRSKLTPAQWKKLNDPKWFEALCANIKKQIEEKRNGENEGTSEV